MALPLKSRLSDDFLAQTPNITKIPIDFSQTALPEYAGLYAVVLENVLTKAECDALVSAAEASNEAGWEPAMINVGGGRQRLVIDQRKCGRIIWDSPEIAARLWNRVRPLVPEIELLDKSSDAHKTKRNLKKHSWEATRLNERLRFLKYGAGDYFKRKSIRYVDDLTAEVQIAHCDGVYWTPDRSEESRVTLHLYLNEGSADGGELKGGATTFHSMDMQRRIDILPKKGRVLIFQHAYLLHSGGAVTAGTKITMRTDLMYKKLEENQEETVPV